MKNNLIGPRHSTDRFTYSYGVFVTEASDFGNAKIDGRLWADSCDIGFVMVSARTGKEEEFYLDRKIYSADGNSPEVMTTVYHSVRKFNGKTVEAHILND